MSKTVDQGKAEIVALCDYFAKNREAFHASGVKEAHVRQTLIDPFFEALGWNVANNPPVAPQYREVIPEDSIDVEGEQKAPDYTFRVGTLPKFYVEAKKCGVNISADPAPAYQLRRYGWSAKVAVSVLTDFEELAVYDCTIRPRPGDKAGHARIHYFRFDEYPDRWRELWDTFSRDAVWSGAFDQYAASKRKRGTSEVDEEFLKEIEGWRDVLARNIALRNRGLSSDDLNRAVQLTIDRLIFLRMAEDRGLESYAQLLALCSRPGIYCRFMADLCRKADDKYNSGLFHFQKEDGVSEDPDRITPGLAVDDAVLRPILERLYFEHGSPYHFGVLPVEILGTVYERFLGKVIRLTADHHAKVEEKPEVRKAGGVYYTPKYIVDYIVRQTVGCRIEGRSPAQLAGSVAPPPSGVRGWAGPQLPFAKPSRDQYRRNLPHIQMAERSIFLTFCTADRWELPERVRDLVMNHCLHDHGVKYQMHGVMVMPDHVHMILSLHRDPGGVVYSLAEVMNGIKGSSAHSINKALKRKGHVWQDESYDHVFRTQEDLRDAVEYICWNPVRKGLVAKVEDWPWLWREWVEGVAPPPPGVQSAVQSAQPGAAGPQVKQPFRVLDMACGSGSFLLGAYQCLLDHCLKWYAEHRPQAHKKAVYNVARPPNVAHPPSGVHSQPGAAGPQADWRLTVDEKKRILTTHIFGVDIDPQAVEVSKLSLLLKVLEGETSQSLHMGLLAFKDRALPNLADNIKCGNSLIGPDYFTGRLIPDPEEFARVNAFDWKREFPDAMKAGGFDCVIGNPPWLMAGYYIGNEIDYLRAKFKTAEGKFDLYYLFLEKGHLVTKESGRFGMIVPNKFFHTRAAGQLRRFLRGSIEAIVDFREGQVFSGATNYSCIVTLARTNKSAVRYAKATTDLRIVSETKVDRKGLAAEPWSFAEKDKANLFAKMESVGNPLETLVTRFGTGVQSGADRILTVTREQASELGLEMGILRPVLRGRDVRRYAIADDPKLLVFPYKTANKTFALLSEKELQSHRTIYRLLCNNKKALGARVWFGKGAVELSGNWWGMMYLDSYSAFTSPHILTPSLSNRSNFAVGKGTLFATGTAGVTSIIPREDIAEDLRYILALLNSRLLGFYAVAHSPVFSGNYFKFSAPYLRHLPIRRVDMSRRSDKAAHDRMVKLVDSMLALHKQVASVKSEAQRGAIQHQIEATDREIDRLVYDLYGLTKDEIAIVAGADT